MIYLISDGLKADDSKVAANYSWLSPSTVTRGMRLHFHFSSIIAASTDCMKGEKLCGQKMQCMPSRK
jgi:hypothetical protein